MAETEDPYHYAVMVTRYTVPDGDIKDLPKKLRDKAGNVRENDVIHILRLNEPVARRNDKRFFDPESAEELGMKIIGKHVWGMHYYLYDLRQKWPEVLSDEIDRVIKTGYPRPSFEPVEESPWADHLRENQEILDSIGKEKLAELKPRLRHAGSPVRYSIFPLAREPKFREA